METKYLTAVSYLEVFSNKTLNKLINAFGSANELWNASAADLYSIEGLRSQSIEKYISKRNTSCPDKINEELEKKKISALTINSVEYPEQLRQIYDAPMVIYYKGNISLLQSPANLAFVGSRKASNYINDIIYKMLSELSIPELNIISGFAAGVDTFAHTAALANGLSTTAVMGSGLDVIYPSSNKGLYQRILDNNGLLLSEYPPKAKPDAWRFPQRNRIVSGLSKGIVVAEAGIKSGALITARLALEQGREVMCIPGAINNPNTEGVYELIKDGAPVITCSKDILECLGWHCNSGFRKENNNIKIELLDNEQKVYDILKLESKQFDDLLNQTQINIDELLVILTNLEISGLIRQLPGQRFETAISIHK